MAGGGNKSAYSKKKGEGGDCHGPSGAHQEAEEADDVEAALMAVSCSGALFEEKGPVYKI